MKTRDQDIEAQIDNAINALNAVKVALTREKDLNPEGVDYQDGFDSLALQGFENTENAKPNPQFISTAQFDDLMGWEHGKAQQYAEDHDIPSIIKNGRRVFLKEVVNFYLKPEDQI